MSNCARWSAVTSTDHSSAGGCCGGSPRGCRACSFSITSSMTGAEGDSSSTRAQLSRYCPSAGGGECDESVGGVLDGCAASRGAKGLRAPLLPSFRHHRDTLAYPVQSSRATTRRAAPLPRLLRTRPGSMSIFSCGRHLPVRHRIVLLEGCCDIHHVGRRRSSPCFTCGAWYCMAHPS
jgi:hypothetical protein